MDRPRWKIFRRGGISGVLGPDTPPRVWVDVKPTLEAEEEVIRLITLINQAHGLLHGHSDPKAISAATILKRALPEHECEGARRLPHQEDETED